MDWTSFCFGATLVVTVYLYDLYFSQEAIILDIEAIWESEIVEPGRGPSRILVGVNTNLDMVVSAVDLLKHLHLESTVPHDHSTLSSLLELEQLVAFSMYHCAAVERIFTNKTLFNMITATATSIPHIYHIGGNAALMAEKLKITRRETEVILIGPIGHRLRELLPDDITTPTFANDKDQDEIHMILEYSVETQWGDVKANCANRIIFSHDISNSKMTALTSVPNAVAQFSPDLVILSGAHLLGGLEKAVWKQRLNAIAEELDTTLHSIPVHWELGTIGNMEFFRQLSQVLFPRINSLGLNEQELLSVAKSCNAPFDFDRVPQKPGIDWVSDLLHWLMQTYSSQSGVQSSLTRVHLHSLSFHVIATTNNSPWMHSKESVMAGARVAGLQACNTETFSTNLFKLMHPYNFRVSRTDTRLLSNVMTLGSGWSQWSRDNILYYFSPVLVCKSPIKTVGLGDAISAFGLLYSDYSQ